MLDSPPLVADLIEPQQLLLCWQAPDPEVGTIRGGRRFVIATLRPEGEAFRLRYLSHSQDYQDAQRKGFEGYYPSLPLPPEEHRLENLATFMRRLPPRSRADYVDFLRFYGIEGDAVSTEDRDFALLGYTGAVTSGDGFSFVHPFEAAQRGDRFPIELTGFRYAPAGRELIQQGTVKSSLQGQEVRFAREPDNRDDPEAVQILSQAGHIGYVIRGQTGPFQRFLREGIPVGGRIIRVNGKPQQPSILIMVSSG